MARVTVEDCIEQIPNRFELVMVASQRARKIGSGAALTLERDNDKNPVVALREIAELTVAVDELREELVRSHQRIALLENDEEDEIDLMEGEEEWNSIASQGHYAAEDEDEDNSELDEPSLAEIAGDAPEDED